MWYNILFYIVIFKLPVSANMFQVRSVADMTNIHRTKWTPRPQEPPLVPSYESTTSIDVVGRYEGGIHNNQKIISNTIQRRPGTKRQAMPTTRMLLFSRNIAHMPIRQQRPFSPGMIMPQVVLPKQLEVKKLRYNNPQNVANSPRSAQMHQYRVSLSEQRPIHDGKSQADYHVSVGNKDYHEYQLLPQAGPPESRDRNQQNYQSIPSAVFANNGYQQAYQQFQESYNPYAERIDQELFSKAYSTSTAAPVFNLETSPPNTTTTKTTKVTTTTVVTTPPLTVSTSSASKSTTSTMPPFSGGYQPIDDFSGQQTEVCNGKAKCNQYRWTTKKKHSKRTTQEFLLWTP